MTPAGNDRTNGHQRQEDLEIFGGLIIEDDENRITLRMPWLVLSVEKPETFGRDRSINDTCGLNKLSSHNSTSDSESPRLMTAWLTSARYTLRALKVVVLTSVVNEHGQRYD